VTTQNNAGALPDFNPNFINPEAYESEDFSLKPIWQSGQVHGKDSTRANQMDHYLRMD